MNWVTEGQLLCLPMILAGIIILVWSYRRNHPSGNYQAV
jgi:prolipoprotein diacylglyceryltransferase